MTDTRTPQPQSRLVSGARWVLAILAALFTIGAFVQFFLAGVSFFDDAARWEDHSNLGHILGLLPYVMWIPAMLGKAGARVIVATIALLVLFGMQYAFIEADSTMLNALHPLNGSILLVLGFWVVQRSFGLLRRPASRPRARRSEPDASDTLEGATS